MQTRKRKPSSDAPSSSPEDAASGHSDTLSSHSSPSAEANVKQKGLRDKSASEATAATSGHARHLPGTPSAIPFPHLCAQ